MDMNAKPCRRKSNEGRGVRCLEFKPQLKRDHAGRAITAQPDAEQAGRRRSRVRQRSKASLRRRLSRNPRKDHARKSEIRMVEDIEELGVETQLHALGEHKPFR